MEELTLGRVVRREPEIHSMQGSAHQMLCQVSAFVQVVHNKNMPERNVTLIRLSSVYCVLDASNSKSCIFDRQMVAPAVRDPARHLFRIPSSLHVRHNVLASLGGLIRPLNQVQS